ncbi:integrase [Psychrobacillus sp. NPDC096426]|uniref:integrase n=1 Tax=Psychrobacillus sp. NPDC096426 TaxID=3364491 RepID=UPI00382CF676
MQNKFTETYIHQLIGSTLNDVGMNVELKQDNSGVNMSYNFIGNYVGFDVNRLIEACDEMQTPISLELYIKIITIHELGHAMDRDALLESVSRTLEIFNTKKSHSLYELYNDLDLFAMLIEEHRMNIVFEETAWDNAKKLNKEFRIVDDRILETVKAHSLSTYINLYEEDLQLYEELVASRSVQIA